MSPTGVPFVFSATCRSTYGLPDRAPIMVNAETVAQCTSEYSDISPLTGANVAFSTLEGRPSAQNFENSPVLQVRVVFGARCFQFFLMRNAPTNYVGVCASRWLWLELAHSSICRKCVPLPCMRRWDLFVRSGRNSYISAFWRKHFILLQSAGSFLKTAVLSVK